MCPPWWAPVGRGGGRRRGEGASDPGSERVPRSSARTAASIRCPRRPGGGGPGTGHCARPRGGRQDHEPRSRGDGALQATLGFEVGPRLISEEVVSEVRCRPWPETLTAEDAEIAGRV